MNMKKTFILCLIAMSLAAYSSSIEPKNLKKSQNERVRSKVEKEKLKITKNEKKEIVFYKQTKKPNEAFRKKVLIKIDNQNDVKIFNTILSKLDQQNLVVCSIVGRLFTIDDECLQSAKSKYPNPSQQNLFSNAYSSSIKREYEKYAKSINLTMEEIRFLNVAYAFNQHVKSFCGSF